MDSSQTPPENNDKLSEENNEANIAKIELMVTPEQELSASVARKRRTITRKRSTSVTSKNRSQTPMRQDALAAGEHSTSDDESTTTSLRPKTPERKRKKVKAVSSKPTTNETNAENDNNEKIPNENLGNASTKEDDNNTPNNNKNNEKSEEIKNDNVNETETETKNENMKETKDENAAAIKNDNITETKADTDNIKPVILRNKSDSASTSERTSVAALDRSSSIPRQFEEQLIKIDNFVNTNTQELKHFLQKAKTTVEEKGKELRRRKFKKTEEKRSQSTPKQLTEADLMESFRRAQIATAEREKERVRSNSARRYSSGSEKSLTPERPARKPCRPVVQEFLKQKKATTAAAPQKKPQLKSKIKSNKIIEILDPTTSKVIAVKDIGEVSRMGFLDAFKILRYYSVREIYREYRKYKKDMSEEYDKIRKARRRCISHLIILMIFCGFGGIIFKFTEGAFENFYKCGVKRVKRDFIDNLWTKSHNLREEEWKSLARSKLRVFEEELHTAHEAGIHSYSGQRSWSFLNGIVYCLTIVTTIGYGHIYPTTTTGQALTLVYALIGIPLFLIILTDFGKLFTRCIKFLWSFVRRLYYTGSCKKVRKTAHVQEIFKGAQMMYEIATFRRPSAWDPNMNANQSPQESVDGTTAPPTPAISNFEIDDEFNLPISVAILLLVLYIFLGAVLFCLWEGWDFFGSFYFVFISMSTIGFGDYVPRHPIFMIASIVYLVFGLALMSMCINVVQVKIGDTFSRASAKIGATIGLGVAEDGSIKPVPPRPIEMPEVHGSMLSINKNASTSKS